MGVTTSSNVAATYEPIATTTVSGSSISTYTFSSIPSTYTDLVLIMSAKATSTGTFDLISRVNGDTGTNYSDTVLTGNGSAASSTRYSNMSFIYHNYNGAPITTANTFNVSIAHFMNYANTTTYKTVLTRANQAANGTDAIVSLWRSTAAINSITITGTGVAGFAFDIGSTFTLYGIKAA